MLARRLLTAAAGIPILLALILIGGRIYDAVVVVVLLAAVLELQIQHGAGLASLPGWLAGIATAGLALWAPARHLGFAGALATLAVVAVLGYAAGRGSEHWASWSLALLLVVYAGWLGQFLVLLRSPLDHGVALVVTLVLITFAADSAAYFVGRAIGRHKLAPKISPSKTIEGALAGLFAAVVVGSVICTVARLPVPLPVAALLGLVVGAAGQLGDLAESMLKRTLKLKDAGLLVPGHGGLLDRLDSLLFAGAMLYYVAKWVSL